MPDAGESGRVQTKRGRTLIALPLVAENPPPPLKWAGGKRWLVPHLEKLWAGHERRRLVEPFVGGLAVTLGLGPRTALLNDANPHLISFYEWLQRGLDPTMANVPLENDREIFGRNRVRFNALIAAGEQQSAEAATLFYYLNRTCFNGLCRFNASGFFNVPFGRYAKIGYRTEFEVVDPSSPADEFFRLSHYGLPEPMGVKPLERSRIWIWLIAGMVAAAALSLLFTWLNRRRARTVAGKPPPAGN